MRRDLVVLRTLFRLALIAGVSIAAILILDNGGQAGDGRFVDRVTFRDLGVIAWVVSPVAAIAGLGLWWRRDRVVAGVGLTALAAAVGMITAGTLIDCLNRRDTPYPQDQVTQLGTFFGFLGALGVCLAYGLLATAIWMIRLVRR